MLHNIAPVSKTLSLKIIAILGLISTVSPGPAMADDVLAVSLSANATLISDYRFRGISLSDRDIALQGGFDVSSRSGFYIGTWASSIESFEGSETEVDIYGGYAGSARSLEFDVGLLEYTYPGSQGTAYLEAYTSLSGTMKTLQWTIGAAYAFDQENIGGQDNIYIYADTDLSLGQTDFSLAGHIAYEDGAFGDGKWDWQIGLTYTLRQYELGLAYVDTSLDGRLGDAGILVSLGASF